VRSFTPSRALLARPVLFAIVLGALTALGPFTMDLYLPAFPAVARDLLASATAVQATLTATAVGMGAGQLVVGPLSDALGRRWPLVIATTMHIGASALIALSPSIELVALARFAQGFGAAGGAIVASAMVRDLFGGQRLVKMAAQVALVSGFAPIIAPVIGSQLLLVVSWRGVFWILACYGLAVVFTAVLLIPETRTRRGRGLSPRDMIRNVQILVGDRSM
jgi:DHA1 family bicyclomycin/chloramphenicol resistance-like MFS transporter